MLTIKSIIYPGGEMKHTNIIKELNKLGLKPENHSIKWWVYGKKYKCEWYEEPEKYDCAVYVLENVEKNDITYNYFPVYPVKNFKSLREYITK